MAALDGLEESFDVHSGPGTIEGGAIPDEDRTGYRACQGDARVFAAAGMVVNFLVNLFAAKAAGYA